jgi:hypothetical protein
MEFFYNHKPYNILDPTQCAFPKDLVLYIAKGYHPLFFTKNRQRRCMVSRQCKCVTLPFQQ